MLFGKINKRRKRTTGVTHAQKIKLNANDRQSKKKNQSIRRQNSKTYVTSDFFLHLFMRNKSFDTLIADNN